MFKSYLQKNHSITGEEREYAYLHVLSGVDETCLLLNHGFKFKTSDIFS